jgi:hypothetical protein
MSPTSGGTRAACSRAPRRGPSRRIDRANRERHAEARAERRGPTLHAFSGELDRPGLGERRRCLLALTATTAIHRDEPRTTAVHAGDPRPLQGQRGRCCPVASSVATPGRSRTAGIPLRYGEFESAPERIRTSDLRFRRPTAGRLRWLRGAKSQTPTRQKLARKSKMRRVPASELAPAPCQDASAARSRGAAASRCVTYSPTAPRASSRGKSCRCGRSRTTALSRPAHRGARARSSRA